MRNALLIHGWNTKDEYFDKSRPTASNDHWFPWTTKQLVLKGINTVAIEMPNGYYPEYDVWKRELERYDIDENTTLVGHSCGGGFLVRWLSETKLKVGKVILVGPWLGLDISDEPFDDSFFDFKIDSDLVERTHGLVVFISEDDIKSVLDSVEMIKASVRDVQLKEFKNKGHFTLGSLGGPEFPELVDEIVGVDLR